MTASEKYAMTAVVFALLAIAYGGFLGAAFGTLASLALLCMVGAER